MESLIKSAEQQDKAISTLNQDLSAQEQTLGGLSTELSQLKNAVPEKLQNNNALISSEGFFLAGEKMQLSSNGGVQAGIGTFSELYADGHRVLRRSDIVVSGTQPNGHEILWLEPEEIVSTSYALETGEGLSLGSIAQSCELIADTSDVLEGDAFIYTLLLPVHETQAARESVALVVTVGKASIGTIAFPQHAIGQIERWQSGYLQLTLESEVNLCSSADPIQLSVTALGVEDEGFEIIPDALIRLGVRLKDAAAQPCTVHWIP